jgi:hypothetical protein
MTAGSQTWNSMGDPNALNVELDITVIDADAFKSAEVTIWGIPLQTISQATSFINQPFTLSAGMAQGLPLATAQSSEAGTLIKGHVYSSWGNWVMTDMTLNFVIFPGDASNPPPQPNAPNPPPKNIVLNWMKGTMLSQALQQTLQTAYPGQTANINISSQLVAPQDTTHYCGTLRELNEFLRPITHQIMTGMQNYPGVGLCMQQGGIDVHDGTSQSGTKMIQFTDLVGQPTWIALNTISIKVVMRGDLKVSDLITLPPTPVITTADAQSGVNTQLTFQGTFLIVSLRHVGNFRQPSGDAWVTIIEALLNQSS